MATRGHAPAPEQPAAPHDNDAEMSVLSALMLSGSIIDPVSQELDAGAFYRATHAQIYRACLRLHARQEPVDPITVVDELERAGHLDTVGGRGKIHEIAAWASAAGNAVHYARIVRDHADRRRHLTVAHDLEKAVRNGGLNDHPEVIAQLEQLLNPSTGTALTMRFASLTDFISVNEDVEAPLIGEDNDALLPADGLLLMYGDGGAGKTTLSIDALAHLASGTDWLGNPVGRPLTVLLIENEGPRGPFRQLLAGKLERWEGSPFTDRVHVLEDPWTQFTLADRGFRLGLGQQISALEADLVIVGPLASLGAKGTGTPDEITEFNTMINDLRAHAARPFGLWIVHHENKAGDVSGAWERLPDTLVHVSAQGNGRTRVHWRKVRWSSRLHNTSVNLLWDQGGFTLEENVVRDLHAELLEAFEKDDRWRTVGEAAGLIAANKDRVRDALASLVEHGRMVYKQGPPGRTSNAKCWRLTTGSDLPSQSEPVALFGGGSDGTGSLAPPISGAKRVSQASPHHPTDPDQPEPVQSTDEDDDPEETARLLALYTTEPAHDDDPDFR